MKRWSITWVFGGHEIHGTNHEAESEYHATEWARENVPVSLFHPDSEPVIKVEPYTTFLEDLVARIETAKKLKGAP